MRRKAVLEGYAELMTTIRQEEERVGLRRSFTYQPYLSGLARHSLGYDELSSDPNPIKRKDVPGPVKDAVLTYAAHVVRQASDVEKPESKYKDKDLYKRDKNSRIRGEEKLKTLGLSFEEAKDRLILSFTIEAAKRKGKPVPKGRMRGHFTVKGAYKPSYLKQVAALKKFYGK
jgi:hypothetical protein